MIGNNLIYIVNINDNSKQVKCSDYAQYSIKTWEYYCKKWGIDLLIVDENVGNFGQRIWNKELIWKFGKGYDKIGIVDADTMVRWDAPNIFDLVTDGVYGVIAAFGLVSISHLLISYQLWIRAIGGLFLIYLGIKFFFKKYNAQSDSKNNEKSLNK